jgi:hypothetical protein
MTAAPAGLDRDRLEAVLSSTDPSAVLVPPRILRRVIKQACALTGPGLQVPHRKSFVIDRDALLRTVNRHELGIPPGRELPETLLLLAEMDPARLAALRPDEALRKYWRLLFHARVHAEFARLRADGKLTETTVRERVARIGRTDFDAAAAVLRQEYLLLPPAGLPEIYEEFAAFYLELRYFEPHRLPLYFPLVRFEVIERVFAEDVDAVALRARTQPQGVSESAEVAEALGIRDVTPDADAGTGPPNPAACDRLLAAASRSRRRGNLVRAAIRCERAARAGDAGQREEARRAASSDLDHLMGRLQKALALPPAEAGVWRKTIGALLVPAANGRWTVEGRFLYDLQKICLDDEREVYSVDFVEWAVTWFRRPLRRHLPHQRLVLVLKHLRSAAGRLPGVRLPVELRAPFNELLHAAVGRGEERIRERFRPAVRAALDEVGLTGHLRAECVARDKVVEELLDRVVERDLLTMSDLRDAVARNRVKLPDLSGPGEFFLGDRLIRANRALTRHLDGVYRRGEIYLRWLQRFSSAGFGTRVGRFLTRYVVLPFGGAFMLVEGYKEVVHMLPGHAPHPHPERTAEEHAAHQAAHLFGDLLPTGVLGVFLLAMLHVPPFRRGVLNALGVAWQAVHALLVDLPAAVMRLPVVRRILQSRLYLLLYLFVLKPLLFGAPVSLALYLAGYDPAYALGGGAAVFLGTVLLLNSPLGSHVEELLVDRLVRAWELLRRDLLPGLFYLVVGVFRALVERVERLLYAVDEWLRFRTGDSPLSAVVKPVLGLAWFVVAYTVRAVINLFVEPTFNPIKHIPVVTVAAKLLLPFIPVLAPEIAAALDPVLGRWLAGFVAGAVLFFIPGFAGFMVWEFKENWRLYAANQPETLRPQVVGSHGETVLRLLRPGFHSGTVPKLYAKLRHAGGKAARKQEEGLHHVAGALTRFVERDLLALLDRSPRWGSAFRLRPGEVGLGTNRIRIELRCRDFTDPPVCVDIEEQAGYLLAGVEKVGWLPRLDGGQRRTLADALAGLYHLAGVDLVREEIEALLPAGTSYGVTEAGLIVWPASAPGDEAVYPLKPGAVAAPGKGWPELAGDRLLFSGRPIRWADWLEAWERKEEAKPLAGFDLDALNACPKECRQ